MQYGIMSAFGGKADINGSREKSPLMTQSGHSTSALQQERGQRNADPFMRFNFRLGDAHGRGLSLGIVCPGARNGCSLPGPLCRATAGAPVSPNTGQWASAPFHWQKRRGEASGRTKAARTTARTKTAAQASAATQAGAAAHTGTTAATRLNNWN